MSFTSKREDIVYDHLRPLPEDTFEQLMEKLEAAEGELANVGKSVGGYVKRMIKFGFAAWIFGLAFFFSSILISGGVELIFSTPLFARSLLMGAVAIPFALTAFLAAKLRRRIKEGIRNQKSEIISNYHQKVLNTLEEKTKELESFVHVVAHDLRTPLSPVSGFSDLLIKKYGDKLDKEGKDYLNRIRASAIKIDDLVGGLLQLSRIGLMKAPKESVELESVVRDVVDELSPKIEEKGIEVVIGDDLPTFHFEGKRMYQIFSNLISNACEFMGDEGESLVEVDAEDRGDSWLLWVKDTGIGIDPEYHEKIFEIFQKVEVSDQGGTGVGLSIVKRILETHGGKIWVESERGEGSIFYMEFPKRRVEVSKQ